LYEISIQSGKVIVPKDAVIKKSSGELLTLKKGNYYDNDNNLIKQGDYYI